MYTRRWVDREPIELSYRQVRRLESDDLVHWEREDVVWEADEIDLAARPIPVRPAPGGPVRRHGVEVSRRG